MNVVHFVSQKGRESREAEKAFIDLCRDRLTLWGPLEWDALKWNGSGILFTNLDQKNTVPDSAKALHPGIKDFARAYIRYQQSHNRTQNALEIRAIRCVERALIESGSIVDIHHISAEILDEAALIAIGRFTGGPAYQAGVQLERLAKFLTELGLVERRLVDWKNPIPRPTDRNRTGREAQAERDAKMPDADALNAIAMIYSLNPSVHRDIFATAAAALMLCAPSRGTEVLSLTSDCEHHDTKSDGSPAYGWRFRAGKDYADEIKWIPDEMVPLAKEAIHRIRVITAEARRIAKWLEDRPNNFYRHEDCPNVDEDQPLSESETIRAMGLSYAAYPDARSKLKSLGISMGDGANTLRSLNQKVREKLPASFPFLSSKRQVPSRVRYSEALFCFQVEQLATDARTSPMLIWWPTVNVFNSYLQARDSGKSLFQRYATLGINPNSKITSHQFRHYLNTLANRGGMSAEEIAAWSGRSNQRQNAAYDQRSERELVESLRSADPTARTPSRQDISRRISESRPIRLEDLDASLVRGVHVTDFGYCDHDFVIAPCPRFRDCSNCAEQVCIKGDPRNDGMRVKLGKVEQALEIARAADQDGDLGADRWVETQLREVARLKGFIEIFDDLRVPNGTLIRLRSDVEFSRVQAALQRNHFVLTVPEPFQGIEKMDVAS
jgi:hypothetical protein